MNKEGGYSSRRNVNALLQVVAVSILFLGCIGGAEQHKVLNMTRSDALPRASEVRAAVLRTAVRQDLGMVQTLIESTVAKMVVTLAVDWWPCTIQCSHVFGLVAYAPSTCWKTLSRWPKVENVGSGPSHTQTF
jgi:hypothetical protein